MKILKIYRAIRLMEHCTDLEVNGVVRRICFSGGSYTQEKWGVYSTSDKAEQDALEKSKQYGFYYKLESEMVLEEDPPQETESQSAPSPKNETKPKAEKETKKTSKGEKGKTLEKVIEPAPATIQTDVLSFPNFNALRRYLMDTFGALMTEVRTTELAKAYAKKNNITVEIK